MDEAGPAPARRRSKPRQGTAQRREEILRAATNTFGTRGYRSGSLAEVAEQVGMTHAGVLHHFGSKENLLIAVLEYRDHEDVRDLAGQHIPDGLELFWHLVRTAAANAQRDGIVQAYAVLTGESVTDGHPAAGWVRSRFEVLRGEIEAALRIVCPPGADDEVLSHAASAVIGVMDGLQLQWLLDRDAVDLPEATRFALEAILVAALAGADRPRPLTP